MEYLITAIGLLIFDANNNEQFYISWDSVQSYKVIEQRLKPYDIQLVFTIKDGERATYVMTNVDKAQEFLKELRLSVMTEVLMKDNRSRYHYECGGKISK